MLQIVYFLFNIPVVYRPHPFLSILMRLRMLKLSVGKGRQVIKQLCRRVLQYCASATVATERAGYVLYRALVIYSVTIDSCPTTFYPLYAKLALEIHDQSHPQGKEYKLKLATVIYPSLLRATRPNLYIFMQHTVSQIDAWVLIIIPSLQFIKINIVQIVTLWPWRMHLSA